MKRLLFLFYMFPILSSSSYLVDASCYKDKEVFKIKFYSGTCFNVQDVGWQERVLIFDQESKLWKNSEHNCELSSTALLDIIEEARTNESDHAGCKKDSFLQSIGCILKAVQWRDPVRIETFKDNVFKYLGKKQDLLGLLLVAA